jgi:putative glutamine amidotransferase
LSLPLIGITTSRYSTPAGHPLHGVAEAYTRSVSGAGGLPVLIPLGLPEEDLRRLAGRLAGVLFTGGGDVHPDRYQAEPHPLISDVDEDRDRVELALLQAAAGSGTPFLGICRGLQLINVALGGTLVADIESMRPGSLKHDYFPDLPRDLLTHPVHVEAGSRLAGILGEREPQVNSLHHQGVERLAGPLQACACAPDRLVEAVELPGHPFGLAVQWHPEWLQAHEPMRRLFRAFVEAAGAESAGP